MGSSVLFVTPYPRDVRSLAQMLEESSIAVIHAESVREARGKLREETFGVVLTESKLEDGNWLDVLELARSSSTHVVVTDAWADAPFWATAINLGAYDLLAQPFRRTEVRRVLASASLRPLCLKVSAAVS